MLNKNRNIDEQEIAKFSRLAKDWWDPFGPFKPLHAINPLRLGFIQQHVPLAYLRVLDVGCGGGILSESMAKLGAVVTGLDLSCEAIAVANQHAHSQQLTMNYHVTSVEEYAADFPGEFDVITCMELLEHVPDPTSIICACAKLLKPEGHLFLSTINRNLKAYLYAILGAEYCLKLLPKGTHDYEKFIKPSELLEMLQGVNLEMVHMTGLTFHPILNHYQLTPNTSVNYLAHCRFA